MIAIILCALGTIWTDSINSYEQLTTDYFFETIWHQEYGDFKSVEFDSRTDTSVHVGHIYGCRQWDENDRKEFVRGKTREQVQLKHPQTKVVIKGRSNSKRLKLLIGTRIQVGDTFVVQISVYKPYQFVDHYFIKFDSDGRIIDKCRFNEII